MDLTQLNKWNDQLYGLPAGSLVFVACLAYGYAIKLTPFIPNKFIPISVIMFGAAANLALAEATTTLQSISRSLLTGFIIGTSAWLAHYSIISKIEDMIFKKSDK